MISIKLNIRGVSASRPRVTKFGTYNSPKYHDYKELLRTRFRGFEMFRAPMALEVEVNFFFVPAKGWKRTKYQQPNSDADNLLKGVLDAANGLLFEDDMMISKAIVTKSYSNVDAIFITLKEIK